MSADRYEVAVVGVDRAEGRLARAGVIDIAVVDGCDLSECVFAETAHTWTLPACEARVVITNQIRSGRDDLAPYLGVAVHGAPNYFMVTGVGAVADAGLDYIAECLTLMRRTGNTRIEVRYSTQRMFDLRGEDKADEVDASYWQRMAKLAPTAFDLSSHTGVLDEVYDGTATICAGDEERRVRVRLSGRLDPIDGRYHWQGTVYDPMPGAVPMQPRPVTLTIGEQTSACRITERTPQGRYSVAGVGVPPYTLDGVEAVVPTP